MLRRSILSRGVLLAAAPAFMAASPILAAGGAEAAQASWRDRRRRHRTGLLIEDVSVPIPRIPDLLVAVEAIAAAHDTTIPVIGHAGDGNLHPLVTFDAADPAATARAEAAFDDVMWTALDLGGSVTGEHGVGSLKARHLARQLGPDVLELTKAVKAALDPTGILNPGKWV